MCVRNCKRGAACLSVWERGEAIIVRGTAKLCTPIHFITPQLLLLLCVSALISSCDEDYRMLQAAECT